MLNSCNLSQSGIPSSAGPLHDTTKKLHPSSLLLLMMETLHNAICGMHELFMCAILLFLSIDFYTSIIFVFGHSSLNILMGI